MVALIVFVRSVLLEIHTLNVEIWMNVWKIHVVQTPSVSTQLEAMIANVNVDSLEIHLQCAHQFKLTLNAMIQKVASAVNQSLVHQDIDVMVADA